MPNQPADIPRGFSIETDEVGNPIIHYRCRQRESFLVRAIQGTLALLVAGALAFVGFEYIDELRLWWLGEVQWFLRIFCVVPLFVIGAMSLRVATYFFAATTFHLSPTIGVAFQRRLCGFSRTKYIPRERIEYVEQIKDGGSGDDRIPSWGLVLQAGRRHRLLKRQPIEVSDWLGKTMAEVLRTEFRPCKVRR